VPDPREPVRRIVERLGQHPAVVAVVLAGSRAASANDPASDFDLYVYATSDVPVEFRRSLASPDAEIDNRFWEPGDEWTDADSGAHLDVMYRSPAWIEDQLDRVLVRHEASIGYSACFWYSVLHSEALYDPHGWYRQLQERARVPYPEALQQAIVAKNWPILRKNQSSYRKQIELALARGDAVSVQHRTTAVLASYFDIWFALASQPHPGEKRLLQHLPEPQATLVRAVIDATPDQLLQRLDALLDALDSRLHPIEENP
jgi:predicted nucleotidyltransferase